MKTFSKFLTAVLAVGLMSYGCQPEGVEPKNASNNPAADGSEEHPPVDPICGNVWDGNILDNDQLAGASFAPRPGRPPVYFDYGYVNAMNNTSSCVIQFTCTAGWYTANNAIFVGLLANCPRHADGTLAPEQFPNNNSVNPVRQLWEAYIPITSNTPQCPDIVVWANIGRLDGAGNLTNIRPVWAAGTWNAQNQGYSFNWCWSMANCPLSGLEVTPACTTVLTGYPGTECTTLTANEPVGGTPPFTYTWTNNRDNTTLTGQSVQACPTQTTTYTVHVCDALSRCATASAAVNVVYVGCTGNTNGNGNGNQDPGNSSTPTHKVIVCHKPPGNPANVQTICVDWDAVPAHVERFRDPTMNPNMGHDSGCEIGPCTLGNPCL